MKLTEQQKEWLRWELGHMIGNGFWEKNLKDLNMAKRILERLKEKE